MLGLDPLAGARVAIALGLGAPVRRRPAVLPGSSAVRCRVATGDRRPDEGGPAGVGARLAGRGDVALLGLAVSLVGGLVPPVAVLVAEAARFVAGVGGDVPPLAGLVALIAQRVALAGRAVAIAAGQVAHAAGEVALPGGIVPATGGGIALGGVVVRTFGSSIRGSRLVHARRPVDRGGIARLSACSTKRCVVGQVPTLATGEGGAALEVRNHSAKALAGSGRLKW